MYAWMGRINKLFKVSLSGTRHWTTDYDFHCGFWSSLVYQYIYIFYIIISMVITIEIR